MEDLDDLREGLAKFFRVKDKVCVGLRVDGRTIMGAGSTAAEALTDAFQTAYPDKKIDMTHQIMWELPANDQIKDIAEDADAVGR